MTKKTEYRFSRDAANLSTRRFHADVSNIFLSNLYLWLRSEILIIKSLNYKRISFCFGLSDIEEPLAGIYKHSLWHFIYFITT